MMRFRIIAIIGLVSSVAFAASDAYLDPSRILYDRPNAATQLQLIECFQSGTCTHDDKIRIYPMPCEGSGNADCTGCYRTQGGTPVRISDLNSQRTCAGMGRPGEQLLRVFVGYERNCPGATVAGTSCTDGRLLLSCSVASEGVSEIADALLGYNKDCFSGRAYARRAQSPLATVTALPSPVPTVVITPTGDPGCAAGTTGTYPSCIPCSDTSYKPTSGANACTACVPPTILNSASVITSTAGTTKTSVNDCRTTFTCQSGYTLVSATQSCVAPPSPTPSPSPILPPAPTPSPTPSPTPTVSASCNTLNLTANLLGTIYVYSGCPKAAEFRFDWSPVGVNGDFFWFEIFNSSQVRANGTIQSLDAATGVSTTTMSFCLSPGNYTYTFLTSMGGTFCPSSSPVPFTVPY